MTKFKIIHNDSIKYKSRLASKYTIAYCILLINILETILYITVQQDIGINYLIEVGFWTLGTSVTAVQLTGL